MEAWHNYERLLLSFHGFHLHGACTKYKLLMLSLDRKYIWSSLAILDMRHRLSLSGHSVQFDTIDSVLFSSIMDPTTVKTAATWCYLCKSFDHAIGECPFPSSASTPYNKTIRGHRAAAQGYQTSTISQAEVCNNFNNLYCVLTSCKRLHVCRSCRGHLPYELCVKQWHCTATKAIHKSSILGW